MKNICVNYNTNNMLSCGGCNERSCVVKNCFHPVFKADSIAPLGIQPKSVWNRQRSIDLKMAVNRYFEADKPIPIEWIEEYNELNKK
jgi:hypothetical protein